MNQMRRNTLRAGSGAGLMVMLAAAGIVKPGELLAAEWNKGAFEGKTLQDALRALGAGSPATSADVVMHAADIAENGAVVPVGVESRIPGTESIAILVEKNPNPLAASFSIPAGTDASVTTRVKLGQTSNVYALVSANGKFYMTKKEIKVTIGGCGG